MPLAVRFSNRPLFGKKGPKPPKGPALWRACHEKSPCTGGEICAKAFPQRGQNTQNGRIYGAHTIKKPLKGGDLRKSLKKRAVAPQKGGLPDEKDFDSFDRKR